jgi:pimeloyl-ACP methyl ester carboxylesterase
MEVLMGYITTRDKTRLYVKDWGSGRPVVLLHGWPLSADSWDDQAMALADNGFRAIAYDRRGFGRSDQPWSGYDYDTLADDLAAVIEQTGAQDAAIVGFSMAGGEIARYMSRHDGKNVAQAGLISSVVPYMLKTADNPKGVDKAVFDEIIAGLKKDRTQFFADFFKNFFGGGPSSPKVSDELIEWARTVSLQSGIKPTIDCVKAFSTTDFRPDLAAFSVPTLIIHGTADKIVPIDATGREAAKAISNAKFIEYEDAPHGLLATHKDKFIEDLLAFLRK